MTWVTWMVIAFLGTVIYTVWTEVQNIDQHLWPQNTDLKNKINRLQDEVVDLNKTIKVLKENLEEKE